VVSDGEPTYTHLHALDDAVRSVDQADDTVSRAVAETALMRGSTLALIVIATELVKLRQHLEGRRP
jgi:hypothetical protein